MENRNIPKDLLLPHRETRGPSRSPLEVNQVQAMDNPHQAPRNTTTTNSTDIGRPLWINHPLDPRPITVSAHLGIVQLHQLIEILSIPFIRTRAGIMNNLNPRCREQIQLRIMRTNQRIMSKITHNKDGLCSGIGFYQVKAREDPKQLQDIIPSLHSPRPQLHQYRLQLNY